MSNRSVKRYVKNSIETGCKFLHQRLQRLPHDILYEILLYHSWSDTGYGGEDTVLKYVISQPFYRYLQEARYSNHSDFLATDREVFEYIYGYFKSDRTRRIRLMRPHITLKIWIPPTNDGEAPSFNIDRFIPNGTRTLKVIIRYIEIVSDFQRWPKIVSPNLPISVERIDTRCCHWDFDTIPRKNRLRNVGTLVFNSIKFNGDVMLRNLSQKCRNLALLHFMSADSIDETKSIFFDLGDKDIVPLRNIKKLHFCGNLKFGNSLKDMNHIFPNLRIFRCQLKDYDDDFFRQIRNLEAIERLDISVMSILRENNEIEYNRLRSSHLMILLDGNFTLKRLQVNFTLAKDDIMSEFKNNHLKILKLNFFDVEKENFYVLFKSLNAIETLILNDMSTYGNDDRDSIISSEVMLDVINIIPVVLTGLKSLGLWIPFEIPLDCSFCQNMFSENNLSLEKLDLRVLNSLELIDGMKKLPCLREIAMYEEMMPFEVLKLCEIRSLRLFSNRKLDAIYRYFFRMHKDCPIRIASFKDGERIDSYVEDVFYSENFKKPFLEHPNLRYTQNPPPNPEKYPETWAWEIPSSDDQNLIYLSRSVKKWDILPPYDIGSVDWKEYFETRMGFEREYTSNRGGEHHSAFWDDYIRIITTLFSPYVSDYLGGKMSRLRNSIYFQVQIQYGMWYFFDSTVYSVYGNGKRVSIEFSHYFHNATSGTKTILKLIEPENPYPFWGLVDNNISSFERPIQEILFRQHFVKLSIHKYHFCGEILLRRLEKLLFFNKKDDINGIMKIEDLVSFFIHFGGGTTKVNFGDFQKKNSQETICGGDWMLEFAERILNLKDKCLGEREQNYFSDNHFENGFLIES